MTFSHIAVSVLFRGNAQLFRPSTAPVRLIASGPTGFASIQEQVNQEDKSTDFVVRFTNYIGADGLNGRILPGLPIHRNAKVVSFKTSSKTTGGTRYKGTFVLKFETIEEAEEFEMCWRLKNGSTASLKADDNAKEEGSHSNNNNLPLKDTTNNVASSTPLKKRKASPMKNGPLRKRVKGRNSSLDLECTDDKKNNGTEFKIDGKIISYKMINTTIERLMRYSTLVISVGPAASACLLYLRIIC
ncbi:hypothetical protein FRACYDRAFT_244774 [Fragilariopsis cylindrus CCMP1102]|uniref:Uncharacterized protein n=1 Tax=Fragilariopsis cylindrus CCMP1102 TaxID=635003 RepID=A0A1E7F0P1_9STRA|nr:hypothetical protein FRACYDRAFT_244774 [Fragilariopsis cylindrus CCMP1102]|eukprot:OEU11656.1 hypothetical protein FRACYDRAFT_244774 [Fragilariopsis cylindrus CCMP1102]